MLQRRRRRGLTAAAQRRMKFVYTLSTAATNAAINETKFTIFAKN